MAGGPRRVVEFFGASLKAGHLGRAVAAPRWRCPVQSNEDERPVRSSLDPNLTIMPALRAPIDEGRLIPHPPRNPWNRLLIGIGLVIAAVAFLSYVFVRSSALD